MKRGILKLLSANEPGTDKYHETVTWAWMCVVERAMGEAGVVDDFSELLHKAPYLLNKRIIDKHYSQAMLNSVVAKRYRLSPDLVEIRNECCE